MKPPAFRREDLARRAPRRLGEEELPPRAYLPGRGPHPIRSPEGHLHGLEREPLRLPPGGLDHRNPDWRAGIDLYDRGFFWEAHERWEGLWHALGRRGDEAMLLKALIQAAAAQIKLLLASRRGVELLHEKSAAALAELAGRHRRLLGLDLGAYLAAQRRWFAGHLAGAPLDLENFPFIRLEEDA